MSGPKAYTYSVQEIAAQREAREMRAARAAEAAAETRWAAVRARIDAARETLGGVVIAMPAPPRAQNTTAAVEARARQLDAMAATAAGRLTSEQDEHARRSLQAHLTAVLVGIDNAIFSAPTTSANTADIPAVTTRTASEPANVAASTAAPAAQEVAKTRAALRATLDKMPGQASAATRLRAAELGDQIVAARNASRIQGLLGTLDQLITVECRRVEEAAVAAAARTRTAADLAALRAQIQELPMPEAAALQATIDDVAKRQPTQMPPALPAQVKGILRAHTAEENRRYVARTLSDGLNQLGYTVGPDFDTALNRDGVAYARTDDAFGVKVRFEADSDRFTAQVVSHDNKRHSQEEDTTAQHQFCQKMNLLTNYVDQHGMTVTLQTDHRAGEIPVQQIAAQAMPRARRTVIRQQRHA